MRKKLGNIILVLILFIGIGLLVYPTFSDWWNSFHQTRAIAGYTAQVANMDKEDFDRMRKHSTSTSCKSPGGSC